MTRFFHYAFAAFMLAMVGGCAAHDDDFLCGGSFKSVAELERVHGKENPGAPSSTISY